MRRLLSQRPALLTVLAVSLAALLRTFLNTAVVVPAAACVQSTGDVDLFVVLT